MYPYSNNQPSSSSSQYPTSNSSLTNQNSTNRVLLFGQIRVNPDSLSRVFSDLTLESQVKQEKEQVKTVSKVQKEQVKWESREQEVKRDSQQQEKVVHNSQEEQVNQKSSQKQKQEQKSLDKEEHEESSIKGTATAFLSSKKSQKNGSKPKAYSFAFTSLTPTNDSFRVVGITPGLAYWEDNPYEKLDTVPTGYLYLIKVFNLIVPPNYILSVIDLSGVVGSPVREPKEVNGIMWNLVPMSEIKEKNKHLKIGLIHHLRYAIDNEGINLCILAALFSSEKFSAARFEKLLASSDIKDPTNRRLWYLYEFLTDMHLESIKDLSPLENEVLLLDKNQYFTSTPKFSPRHRVDVNLLGNREFCPMVRRDSEIGTKCLPKKRHPTSKSKTPKLKTLLDKIAKSEIAASYAIEHRSMPSSNTAGGKGKEASEVLVEMFQKYCGQSFSNPVNTNDLFYICSKFISADPAITDYRKSQPFIIDNNKNINIKYIPAKPEDVNDMMNGLLLLFDQYLCDYLMDPIVLTAIVSFSVGVIHPFDDGNELLRLFLFHHVLAVSGFYVEDPICIPLCRVISRNTDRWSSSLDPLAKWLMRLISYQWNDEQKTSLEVLTHKTDHWYRYFDATECAKYFTELVKEAFDSH
ncbi:3376_t:CDS:1 [Ambispora leptoticha]|uniref:3376_t:CDS:1 n=1 Tax=Ambispora leptoticha TaxID=144679 RepID=A0A9N9E1S7_9GLOM|nr:3376_t:CDS:1 [Ambispora leptoticha]